MLRADASPAAAAAAAASGSSTAAATAAAVAAAVAAAGAGVGAGEGVPPALDSDALLVYSTCSMNPVRHSLEAEGRGRALS